MNARPVAFITGAAHGIGAATAAAFARSGYAVALLDRDHNGLESMAEQIREEGGESLLHAVDLFDLDAARAAVDATLARWDRLDALINNAAWRTHQTMRTIDVETWERTLRICLTAPAFLAKWAAQAMQERGLRGAIVNVSSMMSERAGGISPAYVTSKGGLDALTYELAALYGPVGIRVVAVNPGWVDTELSNDYATPDGASLSAQITAAARDQVPLGRAGTPEEIAKALVWLAGPDASYITGARLLIDGGWLHHHTNYSLHRLQFPEEFP
ncbi:MAG TPA: SDR family oxidoreductase [Chthonomonadaceae bacterium]|nr:SDR family oxidoreductase [Chthonomonadaceae bacterium]